MLYNAFRICFEFLKVLKCIAPSKIEQNINIFLQCARKVVVVKYVPSQCVKENCCPGCQQQAEQQVLLVVGYNSSFLRFSELLAYLPLSQVYLVSIRTVMSNRNRSEKCHLYILRYFEQFTNPGFCSKSWFSMFSWLDYYLFLPLLLTALRGKLWRRLSVNYSIQCKISV